MAVQDDLALVRLPVTKEPVERDPYRFYPQDSHPLPEMLLEREGVGTLPLKDITVIAGKAKNGKSFVVSIFVASILSETDFFTPIKGAPKVLYFDTEQSDSNVAIIYARICTLISKDPKGEYDFLQFFELRGMEGRDGKSAEETRYLYIIDKVLEFQPTAIVIDGISDIMNDPNDEQESKDVVGKLCKLCSDYNIALLTVIHENKSKDDQNPRGHLGSELLRKAVSIFHVTKDRGKGTFTVENTECRNRDVEDWSFTVNSKGIPEIVETVNKQAEREAAKLNDLRLTFADVFRDGEPRLHTQLKNDFVSLCGGCDRTAIRKIKEATEAGILVCNGGKYSLPSEPETE